MMDILEQFSTKRKKDTLPISKLKRELLFLVKTNPVTILCGETGSGKTTQLPQYLHEAGYSRWKIIACTQPRRLAATSVAARVADEMQCHVGAEVGYSIRFDNAASERTKILYMTDGMLVRECIVDPLLSRYSVVMVDEAHERTIYTDVLIGLLKRIQERRADLRIIVSSATLQVHTVLDYFNRKKRIAQAVTVQGRMYPVDIFHLATPCDDYIVRATETIQQIHSSGQGGDILVFLTGREEIERCVDRVRDLSRTFHFKGPKLVPLPLYAGLQRDAQERIFEPTSESIRKVIVATNIAEASVTIDGIVFVIDCGFVKLRVHEVETDTENLVKVPISKANAVQRAGRAGRTQAGKCFRLFPKEVFDKLSEVQRPEIQRVDLSMVLLQLNSLHVQNVLDFDFLSPPSKKNFVYALAALYRLNAVDEVGNLTQHGERVAQVPLDAMSASVLVSSGDYECAEEILSILAMTSLDSVFTEFSDSKALGESKAKFTAKEGDHLTLYNIFQSFVTKGQKDVKWCKSHHLNFQALSQAISVRSQLRRYLDRLRVNVRSCNGNSDMIIKCLCSVYFTHAAQMQPDGSFRSIIGQKLLYAHPSSTLFNLPAELVIYQTVLETKEKAFMKQVTRVEREWLLEAAPEYYKERRR